VANHTRVDGPTWQRAESPRSGSDNHRIEIRPISPDAGKSEASWVEMGSLGRLQRPDRMATGCEIEKLVDRTSLGTQVWQRRSHMHGHMQRHARTMVIVSLLSLAVTPIVGGQAYAAVDDARNLVTRLGNEAVTVLQSQAPLADREKRLQALFRDGFDLDFIGRFVLGQYWNRATSVQRDEYRRVFRDFVTQTYARQLAGETVTRFAIVSANENSDHDVIVETLIERPKGPPLKYGWRVRDDKVIDIFVEGVSLLVSKRDDFTSVAQREGIDGLIASLRQKVQQSSDAGPRRNVPL
jgi:phospholipid transport system substrate-binding protein